MRRPRPLSCFRLAPHVALAALAAFVLAGCAKETAPARPHSITGHLRVVGYLVAADSHFLGARTIDNASGVRVDLLYGTRVVASTTTTNGTYRFENVAAGGYVARASAMGLVAPVTNTLTVASADVVARDTLTMQSLGDLYPTPNPLVDNTIIAFDLGNNTPVTLDVFDSQGALVQRLISPTSTWVAGYHEAIWDGKNGSGQYAPVGIYWAYMVTNSEVRCQALFRDELPAGPRRVTPAVRMRGVKLPSAKLAR